MTLDTFDWIIIIVYLIGMVGLSFFLARGQKTERDYYLGGITVLYDVLGGMQAVIWSDVIQIVVLSGCLCPVASEFCIRSAPDRKR